MRNLISTALIASLFSAVANTLWMLYESGGGRIRDVGLPRLVRFAGILVNYDPARVLPDGLQRYQDLTQWNTHFPFLLTAVALNVTFGVAIALLAALPLFLGKSAARSTSRQTWMCLAVAVVCLLPALTLPAEWITRFALRLAHWWLTSLLISGAAAASCAALLYFLLRGPAAAVRRRRGLLAGAYLGAVIAAGAVAGIVFKPTRPAAPPNAPNILLISIDSLRRDHVSAYGYPRPTTPHIDALARQGVRFDMAVAPTSWTLPSHITLLTSLPARLHGVRDVRQRFSLDVVTLAEVLSDSGYATAGFIAGSFLSATHGFSQGFDVYDDYTILDRDLAEYGGYVTSPRSIALTRRWLDEWEGAGRQRPFFIFLHMWDVHYEYLPPPPYDTMFDPNYEGTVTGRSFMRNPRINADMHVRDLEHIRALYDGEIRYTDDHLGELFNLLQQRGLFDDTITVVTSDHGDEFFEHGGKGHGQSLYDEVLRVPLVMRYPKRIPAGRVVDRQVRLMDVAPTILELADVYRPDSFGHCGERLQACRPLLPWIEGQSEGLPSLISYGHLRNQLQSIRTETAKMIRRVGNNEEAMRFDLVNDPGEDANLFGAGQENVDALFNGLLDQWWSAERAKQGESADIDPGQIEVLRSLGYLK